MPDLTIAVFQWQWGDERAVVAARAVFHMHALTLNTVLHFVKLETMPGLAIADTKEADATIPETMSEPASCCHSSLHWQLPVAVDHQLAACIALLAVTFEAYAGSGSPLVRSVTTISGVHWHWHWQSVTGGRSLPVTRTRRVRLGVIGPGSRWQFTGTLTASGTRLAGTGKLFHWQTWCPLAQVELATGSEVRVAGSTSTTTA